jgi:hypothetical protein
MTVRQPRYSLYGQRSAAGQLGDYRLGDRAFRGPSPRSPASGETCRRPPTQKGLAVVAVICGKLDIAYLEIDLGINAIFWNRNIVFCMP